MSKRHVSQTEQQRKGQYYTTNSHTILQGFEHVVNKKVVIDPFAGAGDLLDWSVENGAVNAIGYDLEPSRDDIVTKDTLGDCFGYPILENIVIVTNPPYLSKNKSKGAYESVFSRWEESDLYKCALASMVPNANEILIVLPSNFFCESRDSIRKRMFKTHHIVSAKYYSDPVFDNATTGIAVVHFRKGFREFQSFDMNKDGVILRNVELRKEYGYLYGADFFEYLKPVEGILKVIKTDPDDVPNTNLVVGLLDNGKWSNGVKYNSGDPVRCAAKSFTTYQITLGEDRLLTEAEQMLIADTFQEKLNMFRKQYSDLFLSNFMGPRQKILGRSYVHRLLERVMMDLDLL